MKVPKSYEGRFVCAQLGAPVYMFEYGAHAVVDGSQYLVPQPIVKQVGEQVSQAMSNLLTGVRIVVVGDDFVIFELYDPDRTGDTGNIMRKLVPSALIMSIDTIDKFECPMPSVTTRVRSEPSRIVKP